MNRIKGEFDLIVMLMYGNMSDKQIEEMKVEDTFEIIVNSEFDLTVRVLYRTMSDKQIDEIILAYYTYCFSKGVNAKLNVELIPHGHTNPWVDTLFQYYYQLEKHIYQMKWFITLVIARIKVQYNPYKPSFIINDAMSEWSTKIPHITRKAEHYEPGKY